MNQTTRHNAFFTLFICLYIVSLFFSRGLNSVLIGASCIFVIYDKNERKEALKTILAKKELLMFIALFVLTALSLLITEDIRSGLFVVLDYSVFLLFSFSLSRVRHFSQNQLRRIGNLYLTCCIIAMVVAFCSALYHLDWVYATEQYASRGYHPIIFHLTYHELSKNIHQHAVFLSLYLSAGIFILIHRALILKMHIVFSLLLIPLLQLFLFFLYSLSLHCSIYLVMYFIILKTLSFQKLKHWLALTYVSLCGACSATYIFIFKYRGITDESFYAFDDPRFNKLFIIAVTLALVAIPVSVVIKKYIKERKWRPIGLLAAAILSGAFFFHFLFPMSSSGPAKEKQEHSNNIDARFIKWEASIILIKKHPVLGTGAGDSRHELYKVYETLGFKEGIENRFNAHNQFLESWFSSGILTLLVLIFLFFYAFRTALQFNAPVYLGVLICFLFLCFSETCLNIQYGRSYFAFIVAFFAYAKLNYEKP